MPAKTEEIIQTQLQNSAAVENDLPAVDEKEVAAALEQISKNLKGDEVPKTKKSFFKSPKFLLIAAVVLLIGLFIGGRYLVYANAHESTDDAFIEGHVIQISPKVTGHITRVYVEDNQLVKKGDLIAEIDPRDYEAKLAQSQAALQAAMSRHSAAQINVGLTGTTSGGNVQQASSVVQMSRSNVESARAQAEATRGKLSQAQAQINTAKANVAQARTQVEAAQAEASRANADRVRYQQLYDSGEVSRQQLDYAVTAARTANAQLEAARTKVTAAEAQVTEAQSAEQAAQGSLQQAQAQIIAAQAQVGEAQGKLTTANAAPQQVEESRAQVSAAQADIEQAKANVMQAQLNLSYTKIYAPEDGRITRKAVEEGAFVQVGQALLAIVLEEFWVTANFKETQLASIRIGQPVEIKVDAYPDKVFKGHVDSFQSGTGARFSLLPPENATGNYVKVVQRVPVKIVFDEQPDPQYPLGPGMSVEPEVQVK